jgi:hypothetical protein
MSKVVHVVPVLRKGPHPPFGHLLHARGRGEGTGFSPALMFERFGSTQCSPFSIPLAGEGGRRPDEVLLPKEHPHD